MDMFLDFGHLLFLVKTIEKNRPQETHTLKNRIHKRDSFLFFWLNKRFIV